MDWAHITTTIERLGTLSPEESAEELGRLAQSDPKSFETVEALRGNAASAASFMQTRMIGNQEASAHALPIGSKVGVWQVDGLLGSGGMGEVYRAHRADGLFEQQVALKLARVKDARFTERFETERQRLAQLEHPNIARIVDGGTAKGGAPYMTMEFVDGQPIDGFVKAKGLSRSERLGLIEKLCAAVAHAHGRLVLHRDIKHDNVLINSDGELRLIDFGVASLIEDTAAETSIGPLTLAYAAPEQLRGEPVSAATDIFAIGMLAHCLETGALPKRQSDGGVAIDRAGIGDEDLAAILAKATADDPTARYGSADALGDDLQKFAGGFPVAARPVSSVTRFKKMVGRNKFASAMSSAAMAALVAGVIGVSVFTVRANEAREEAEYNSAQMEHYARGESLRGEMMQSAFGKTGDQEALADAFTEYAGQADDLKTTEPERAAIIKTVAGQFFMRRNDYPRAISILEPWITEGYGTERSLVAGRGALARSYMDVGRMREAIPLLRENEAYHRSTRSAFTPDHAAAASQLAISSREHADLILGEEVLLKTMKAAPNDLFFGYFYNQLGLIARLQGDFEGSYGYLKANVEQDKKNSLSEITNQDSGTINFAEIQYGYLGANEEAEDTLKVAKKFMKQKGESVSEGRVARLEALMLLGNGEYLEAQTRAIEALPFLEKFAGPSSPLTTSTKAILVEALALQDSFDEARRMASDLSSKGMVGHQADELEARLKIMWAVIAAKEERANPRVRSPGFTASEEQLVCTNPVLLRHYANLAKIGIVTEIECVARLN